MKQAVLAIQNLVPDQPEIAAKATPLTLMP
jgi:hypothetical protein